MAFASFLLAMLDLSSQLQVFFRLGYFPRWLHQEPQPLSLRRHLHRLWEAVVRG